MSEINVVPYIDVMLVLLVIFMITTPLLNLGVEVELLRIGDSLIAPNFKVVVTPKSVEPTSSSGPRQPSETGQRHQVFFQDVLDTIKKIRPEVTRSQRAGYQNWLATPSRKSGFNFNLAFFWRGTARGFDIELYIDTGDKEKNKWAFDALETNRKHIETELDTELSWQRLENARASRVASLWESPVNIMDTEETLAELKTWAIDHYFKFRDVITPYLENLPTNLTDLNQQEPTESYDFEDEDEPSASDQQPLVDHGPR